MRSKEPSFRLTPQRQAILEELRRARDHPDAAELYRRVRARFPSLGFATVYKTLRLLAEHGAIQELAPMHRGDAASHFDGDVHPHSHGLCSRCHAIVDLEVSLAPEQVLSALREQPFLARGYRLEFYGLCPRCQADTENDKGRR